MKNSHPEPLQDNLPSSLHQMQERLLDLERQNEALRRERGLRLEIDALLGTHRDLYDLAPVGYFNWDRSGGILAINLTGARLLGTERSLLIGRRMDLFLTEDSRAIFHDFLAKLFLSKAKASCEVVLLREDRCEIFLHIEAVIVDPQDQCRAVVFDVTARKRAERDAERLKGDLAEVAGGMELAARERAALNRMVAHDLRQPLNVIYSFGQAVMMCGADLDDTCKGYVQEIIDGSLRMNRLITALQEYSRMGLVEPNRDVIDLSALAQGVVTRLTQKGAPREVELRIKAGITACADYDLMTVVMENLLGNSWKYTGTRSDAVIEFGTTESEGDPVYFVRDNGAGIEVADLEKLFLPFQKSSGDKKLRGFGIGLATVARIIARHGGRIWAEGAPGAGAVVYFTCPAPPAPQLKG